MITMSMSRAVKGGRHGRPAGTEAERRPLTARVTSNWTMNVAPPLGGAWRHLLLPSRAQKTLLLSNRCAVRGIAALRQASHDGPMPKDTAPVDWVKSKASSISMVFSADFMSGPSSRSVVCHQPAFGEGPHRRWMVTDGGGQSVLGRTRGHRWGDFVSVRGRNLSATGEVLMSV